MLTHELNNFTMAEAVKFYDQLKSAFKYLVPMGVAANITQPYVETNYSQPDFAQCPFPFLPCSNATHSLFSRHCRDYDAQWWWSRIAYGFKWPIELLWHTRQQQRESLLWCFGRPGCVGRIRG